MSDGDFPHHVGPDDSVKRARNRVAFHRAAAQLQSGQRPDPDLETAQARCAAVEHRGRVLES